MLNVKGPGLLSHDCVLNHEETEDQTRQRYIPLLKNPIFQMLA